MEAPFIYRPRTGNDSSTPRPKSLPPARFRGLPRARAGTLGCILHFSNCDFPGFGLCVCAAEDKLIKAALEGDLGRIKGIPASIDPLSLPQVFGSCVVACSCSPVLRLIDPQI